MSTFFGIWKFGIQLLILWFIVALFMPGIAWYDHVYNIMVNILGYPAGVVFSFFTECYKEILAANWDNNNPIQDFVWLLGVIGSIALSLAIPMAYWFTWIMVTYVAITEIVPAINRIPTATTDGNLFYIVTGRTTVQNTFDAEVIANAVSDKIK